MFGSTSALLFLAIIYVLQVSACSEQEGNRRWWEAVLKPCARGNLIVTCPPANLRQRPAQCLLLYMWYTVDSKMQQILLPVRTQGLTKPRWWHQRWEEERLRSALWIRLLLVGVILPPYPNYSVAQQHSTVIVKMCFMKSEVMFSSNLYPNYKQNSDNRWESFQIKDKVWNIYDLFTV